MLARHGLNDGDLGLKVKEKVDGEQGEQDGVPAAGDGCAG